MREIKFRAWHKILEEMYGDGWHGKCAGEGGANSTNDHLRFLQSHDIVLMQYTGLKDKNGVEIYEGDILGDSSRPTRMFKGVVEWHDDGWKVSTRPGRNYLLELKYQMSEPSMHYDTVIGNIYENPELLTTIGE